MALISFAVHQWLGRGTWTSGALVTRKLTPPVQRNGNKTVSDGSCTPARRMFTNMSELSHIVHPPEKQQPVQAGVCKARYQHCVATRAEKDNRHEIASTHQCKAFRSKSKPSCTSRSNMKSYYKRPITFQTTPETTWDELEGRTKAIETAI
ncbi:hypothetical protein K435DRAFT_800855 [Dendrothele bispora CBS 962.96]|uniref:Uncharacterized protein n=1 Tax=Dendrothele bispora (strain CBS 962.96) TaxID=1314807 RepID=A0A4V4HEQ4_DENBC|nr:hypothetical protein K435DRAFT_800855 [Dendrothele bispora CBS 962.96]